MPRVGDILVMPATGAYCYAMASNYNGNPRPAVLLVNDGAGPRDRSSARPTTTSWPSTIDSKTERLARERSRQEGFSWLRTPLRIGLLGYGTIGSSVYAG